MFLYILFLMIGHLKAIEITTENIAKKVEQFQQSHVINGAIAVAKNNIINLSST